VVSAATVAAIGNGAAFRRGRDFAAWVGVVPRHCSTGGKQKLYGISKRGNVYLRPILIHGARAILFRVKYDTALRRCSQRQLDGRGKDATLGKHRTLSTFPPPRRRALE
jgi:transposase